MPPERKRYRRFVLGSSVRAAAVAVSVATECSSVASAAHMTRGLHLWPLLRTSASGTICVGRASQNVPFPAWCRPFRVQGPLLFRGRKQTARAATAVPSDNEGPFNRPGARPRENILLLPAIRTNSPPAAGAVSASSCRQVPNSPGQELRNGQASPYAEPGHPPRLKEQVARIIPPKEPWLSEASDRLRGGGLVAFPTETVYGLGANALSEEAVLKVFEAKQRPLSDPLIVHVPDMAGAMKVVDFSGKDGGGEAGRRLLLHLGEKLWPGPLTLVLKAAGCVPWCVTAGTGYVGVRCPSHPLARQLLQLSGVPVAAPSANRFGHVSPTKAAHVLEDLGGSDMLILDGDGLGACGVGIESTVAKVDMAGGQIVILRSGAMSERHIADVLAGSPFSHFTVHVGQEYSPPGTESAPARGVRARTGRAGRDVGQDQGPSAAAQSPGQLLQHYSPDIEAFQVILKSPGSLGAAADTPRDVSVIDAGSTDGEALSARELVALTRRSVVVDYGQQLAELEAHALAYGDLSPEGDVKRAAARFFSALRWAEAQPGAELVLVAGIAATERGDLAAAVNDRIYRATGGKVLRV